MYSTVFALSQYRKETSFAMTLTNPKLATTNITARPINYFEHPEPPTNARQDVEGFSNKTATVKPYIIVNNAKVIVIMPIILLRPRASPAACLGKGC